MTNEEIIKQLQDLECHCQEMYDAEVKNGDTSYSIWGKDVEALTMAIKVLEQQPCEYNPFTIDELDDEDIKKKLREYQNQKVLVTEHDCSPSVTIIKPSEDCINREALINELKLGYFNKDLQEGKNDPCVIDAMIDWAIRIVKRQPSVTPQQKIGKWIGGSICNRCNYKKMPLWRYNYCPNCGCRMEGGSEE